MRVALDMRLVARNVTGAGVYATQLLDQLNRSPDVDVYPLRGWDYFDKTAGMRGRALRALADAAWIQVGLPLRLNSLKVDLLHAPAYFAPIWSNCPLVVTVHDTIFRHFPADYAGWWRRYLEASLARVLPKAAAIIVNSYHTKDDLVSDYAVAPDRVKVVYLGVDNARFCPGAALQAGPVLEHYGIRPGFVLHVGTLVTRKNLPLLLEAVAILRERGAWGGRQLALVGEASPGMPGAQAVRESVCRLGLSDIVVMTGRVSDAWLPAIYASASVLAFPSRYEGFGIPLLEAMASGLPVVAARRSAVPEVLGDAGVLIENERPEDFADGLQIVLTSDGLRRELRDRGVQRSFKFSWEETGRMTREVYREVAKADVLAEAQT